MVVALEHQVAMDGDDSVHTIGVRDHDRGIARQFKLSGSDGFAMLGEKRTAGFQLSRVLDRVAADFANSPSNSSVLTAQSVALHPSDVTLICGGHPLVVDNSVYKYCLSENPNEVLAWCPERVRKNGKCIGRAGPGGFIPMAPAPSKSSGSEQK